MIRLFLSHIQRTAGNQVSVLYEGLTSSTILRKDRVMLHVWYDQMEDTVSLSSMKKGIDESDYFLLYLSEGLLTSKYVQYEVKTALDSNKQIILVSDATNMRNIQDIIQEGLRFSRMLLHQTRNEVHLSENDFNTLLNRTKNVPVIPFHYPYERLMNETVHRIRSVIGLDNDNTNTVANTNNLRSLSTLATDDSTTTITTTTTTTTYDSLTTYESPYRMKSLVIENKSDVCILSSSACHGLCQSTLLYCALSYLCSHRSLRIDTLYDHSSITRTMNSTDVLDTVIKPKVHSTRMVVCILTDDIWESCNGLIYDTVKYVMELRKKLQQRQHQSVSSLASSSSIDSVPDIVLVYEGDTRYGGINISSLKQKGNPNDIFDHYTAIPIQRHYKLRDAFYKDLLRSIGAIGKDDLGGSLPPPVLQDTFMEEPVRNYMDNLSRDILDPFKKIICVGGLGGAGKTSITTAVIHKYQRIHQTFDDIYWLTLGQIDKHQLLEKQQQLLHEIQQYGGGKNNSVPDNLTETSNQLRNCLQSRKGLVIVDDVWTLDQFISFIRILSTESNDNSGGSGTKTCPSKIVFTSRSIPQFEQAIELLHLKVNTPNSDETSNPLPLPYSIIRLDELEKPEGIVMLRKAVDFGGPLSSTLTTKISQLFDVSNTLSLTLCIIGAYLRIKLEPLIYEDDDRSLTVMNNLIDHLRTDVANTGNTSTLTLPRTATSPTLLGSVTLTNHFDYQYIFQHNTEWERYTPVYKAIELVLSTCFSTDDRLNFAVFGIFNDDTVLHQDILAVAWRKDIPATQLLLQRFALCGLVKLDIDGNDGGYRVLLHDLVLDYAYSLSCITHRSTGGKDPPSLLPSSSSVADETTVLQPYNGKYHINFLKRIAIKYGIGTTTTATGTVRHWWTLDESSLLFRYLINHLWNHLYASGLYHELYHLCFRLPWLQQCVRYLGYEALMGKLTKFVQPILPCFTPQESDPHRIAFSYLYKSFRLSSTVFETTQGWMYVAQQLYGRLGYLRSTVSSEMDQLIDDCVRYCEQEDKVVPTVPFLTPPNDFIENILVGHSNRLTGMVSLPDGRIVSASDDATLRIWTKAGVCEHTLLGHEYSVRTIVTLPDNRILSGSDDASLRIFSTTTGLCEKVLTGHSDGITAMLLLSDGKLATASIDSTIRIWNLTTYECVTSLEGHTAAVNVLITTLDGTLVTGSDDKTVRVWNVASSACVSTLEGHTDAVTALLALPHDRIVTGSKDKLIRVFNLSTRACEFILEGHSRGILSFLRLSNGKILSTADDTNICVWDTDEGKLDNVLRGHTSGVPSAAELPDGRIVSACHDTTIRVWLRDTYACQHTFYGHSGLVKNLLVVKDKDNRVRIVSSSTDKTIRIWSPDVTPSINSGQGHTRIITDILTLSNGNIVTACRDNTLRLWDTRTSVSVREYIGHTNVVTGVLELPDHERIVSSSCDATLRIWRISTGECICTLSGHEGRIKTMILLTDDRIAAGAADGAIRVWRITGDVVHVLRGHTEEIRCLLALPNNRMVSGADDHTVNVWNIVTGECLYSFRDHKDKIGSLTLLRYDRFLSLAEDNTGRIYNTATGECDHVLEGHTKWIRTSLCVDGYIITGSNDRSARVWDEQSGKCLRIFREGHTSGTATLVRLADGRIILGSNDGTMRIWNIVTGECDSVLQGHKNIPRCIIELADGRIVTSSDDSTVRVWQYNRSTNEWMAKVLIFDTEIKGIKVFPEDNHYRVCCFTRKLTVIKI